MMWTNPRSVLVIAALGGVLVQQSLAQEHCPYGRSSDCEARAIVDAVNAAVSADVPVNAAASVACPLGRLPGELVDLLPLLPLEHRSLIQECAKEKPRMRRKLRTFDLRDLIDDEAAPSMDVAPIAGAFSGRAVDVARSSGLSDEPYPISFDWAVVLDPQSRTLYSFVLNCRD